MTKMTWIERVRTRLKYATLVGYLLVVLLSTTKLYGALRNDAGVMENTRVTSYKQFKGEIPEGHLVRHTYHNGKYWNPDHLMSGTQKQSMEDKVLTTETSILSENSTTCLK